MYSTTYGMVLSDTTIRRRLREPSGLIVHPRHDRMFQPASIDLQIAEPAVLHPRDALAHVPHTSSFQLAHTLQHVQIPSDLVGQVCGTSTWGRRGLLVHCTAAWVDPGFRGQITLELANLSHDTIRIEAGETICQLVIHQLTEPCTRPYGHPELGSRYQDSVGTVAPRERTTNQHPSGCWSETYGIAAYCGGDGHYVCRSCACFDTDLSEES